MLARLALLSVVGAGSARAQDRTEPLPSSPSRLDFAAGEPGRALEGWRALPPATCRFTTSHDRVHRGRHCAELRRDGGGVGMPAGVAGQAFSAETFRGKRVRFSADVRTESGRAELWMRVDRPTATGVMAGFAGDAAPSAHAGEWRRHEVVGHVDEDAAGITIGVLLYGGAQAWIDDASFEVVEPTADPR